AEDGIRDFHVTGVQTCALPIWAQNIDAAYRLVSDVIATRTTAEWLEQLGAADIPAAPLYSVEDLINDPHIQAVDMVRRLNHPSEGEIRSPGPVGSYSRTPAGIRRHAPRLGEHTAEVLAEA